MNDIKIALTLSLLTFFLYFGIATRFSFHPAWTRDYFNPLAQSIMHMRVDLPSPADTYDLSLYNGRWFVPWGILGALFFIPFQLMLGHFFPSLYVSLLCASVNGFFFYLLLRRIQKDFFPLMSGWDIFWIYIFFVFGTTHVYVGTLGSVWHVNQITSSVFSTIGIYIVLKKKRTLLDYFFSFTIIALTLLGRATNVLVLTLPILLYIKEFFVKKRIQRIYVYKIVRNFLFLLIVPAVFVIFFFLYNWIRYQNLFEYGFRYIHEAPYLAAFRTMYGVSSIMHLPRNLWYMVFEMPSLTFDGGIKLLINLKGNSIFFLSPPLLSMFLSCSLQKQKNKRMVGAFVPVMWATFLVTALPILFHYSTGWMQFGYRYSLDFIVPLVILSVFGIRGKPNIIYKIGIIWSVVMHLIGIRLLQ